MGNQPGYGNSAMNNGEKFRYNIERQVRRLKKAESEESTNLAASVYIGTLGLIFVLPMIGGAYLGHWLDSKYGGYWTISLILFGLFIGAMNVYFFIRE